MASKKYPLSSPSPKPSLSPSLSAVRSSTPLSGPLSARLATPPPSNRLPAIPPTQRPPSPDYFEDFEYTQEMDDDFRKIDLAAEVTLSQGIRRPPPQNPPDSPSPLSQRAWVVFRGRTPGIYYDQYVPLSGTKYLRPHTIVLACSHPLRLKGMAATPTRGHSPIASPPKSLGLPMSRISPMVRDPGSSSLAGDLGL